MQKTKQGRDSSIELFRIVSMLIIVAHHYVVNSGLTNMIEINGNTWRSLFLLIVGWGGKTGINCFVLITGYFMCKYNITWRKFLKLFLEVEFYSILFYVIFLVTGYSEFSIIGLLKTIFSIYGIGTGFTHSFLVFYLCIPFVNILIHNMQEKQHRLLLVLCISVFSVLPTFCFVNVKISYVSWFIVLYLISAYIRLYPKKMYENKKIWGIAASLSILVSWCSVIACEIAEEWFGHDFTHFFVSDSNKLLALITAFCGFMYFRNLNIGQSKLINTVAASAFGVLLIHSNSDTMRKWLWIDVFKTASFYNSKFLVLHFIGTVLVIYVICTSIDFLRIKLVEKPLFKWMESKKRRLVENESVSISRWL